MLHALRCVGITAKGAAGQATAGRIGAESGQAAVGGDGQLGPIYFRAGSGNGVSSDYATSGDSGATGTATR